MAILPASPAWDGEQKNYAASIQHVESFMRFNDKKFKIEFSNIR